MIDVRRDLLRIKVELVGIEPPIWREILVPSKYSFWDLHVAIQDAMGWLDYHLHEFRILDERGGKYLVGIPSEDEWEDSELVLPGWEVLVLDFFAQPGAHIEYEYDFGDSWYHDITFLGVQPREQGAPYPSCPAGQRACPPEDCGGVHGYHALLDALFDPRHPEHEALGNWIPQGWGPELFNPLKVRFDNPDDRWNRAFKEEG